MKKLTLMASVAILVGLTSCMNTRILVGNVTPSEPVVEVNKQCNGHFVYGLIPGKKATVSADKLMDGKKDYVVRTYTSFVDGLVGGLTFGIYTPTTTKLYVPLKSVEVSKK